MFTFLSVKKKIFEISTPWKNSALAIRVSFKRTFLPNNLYNFFVATKLLMNVQNNLIVALITYITLQFTEIDNANHRLED